MADPEATQAPTAADVLLPSDAPEKTAEVDVGRLGGQIHEVLAMACAEMRRSMRKLESLESSLQTLAGAGGADGASRSLASLPSLGPGIASPWRSEAKKVNSDSRRQFVPLTPYLGEEWEARVKEETEYLNTKPKHRPGRRSHESPHKEREGHQSGDWQRDREASTAPTTSSTEEAGLKAAAMGGGHPFGIDDDSTEQADAAAARETARDDPARSGARSGTTNSQQVLEDPDPELRELAQSSSVGPPLGPKSSASSMSSPRERLNKFVKGQTFEGIVTMMIFASAIHVGLQTDYMCRYPNDALPLRYRAVDIIFMFFFTLEVLVRLFARGLEFFWLRGWAWNCFDLFLVILQMTEEVLTLTGFGRQSPSAYGLRIVRSLRSVRSMRILQVMEFTEELRLLVSCILHSLQAFFWSILLILMLIYIASIYYAAAVLDYRNDNRGAPLGSEEYLATEKLASQAGNVPLAALSLFQGLTGGMDWGDMSGPMMEYSGWYWGVMFFFFVSFMFFVVLNIVTALFVDNAMARSAVVQHEKKLANATRMFKALDHDNSRQITISEILGEINSDEVQNFFKSIGLHSNEAKTLFQLLDVNGTGELDFNEFVGGCITLQGPARCIDLVRALQELKRSVDGLGLAPGPPQPPDEAPACLTP